MVEARTPLSQGAFQDTEINQHPATVEVAPAGMRKDAVVMSVKSFTFSVIISKEMSCGKISFNSNFVHSIIIVPYCRGNKGKEKKENGCSGIEK